MACLLETDIGIHPVPMSSPVKPVHGHKFELPKTYIEIIYNVPTMTGTDLRGHRLMEHWCVCLVVHHTVASTVVQDGPFHVMIRDLVSKFRQAALFRVRSQVLNCIGENFVRHHPVGLALRDGVPMRDPDCRIHLPEEDDNLPSGQVADRSTMMFPPGGILLWCRSWVYDLDALLVGLLSDPFWTGSCLPGPPVCRLR